MIVHVIREILIFTMTNFHYDDFITTKFKTIGDLMLVNLQ